MDDKRIRRFYMKKILVLLFVVMGLCAKSYKIDKTIKCTYVNVLGQPTKAETYIYVSDETLDIYVRSSIYVDCLKLDKENRIMLLRVIYTYKEWCKIATQDKDKLANEITKDKICFYWKYLNNNDWTCIDPLTVSYNVFSQNTSRHQLVLVFNGSDFRQDIPVLYMEYDDVLELEKILDEDYIIEQLKELKHKEDKIYK
jgi:hypothetical protein